MSAFGPKADIGGLQTVRGAGSEIVLEFADGVLGQGSKSHEAARVHCPSH